MKRMRRKSIVLIATLLMVIPVSGRIYPLKPMNEYVDESQIVARVKLTGEQDVEFIKNGVVRNCGTVFHGDVVDAFKGAKKRQRISFYADTDYVSYSFSVGRDYVLFLSRYEAPRIPKKDVANDDTGIPGDPLIAVLKSLRNAVDWDFVKAAPKLPTPQWPASSSFLAGVHEGEEWINIPYKIVRAKSVVVRSFR